MTDVTTGPVTDQFIKAVTERKSATGGFEYMIGEGKLGLLAKELGELAETVAKSGYIPPALRSQYEKFEKAADRTTDREVARHYRDRARQIRNQLGEGQIHD